MTASKTIILCADDFGLNPGISRGILKLAALKRLSAVSCMVNIPDFITDAAKLLALRGQIKIGLHFNLTEGNLLSVADKACFTLNELLIRTHLSAIKLSFIAQEFKRQLEQFVEVMDFFPDFIDGHQHVHQFPRIRKVILDLYEQYLRAYGVAIRATYPVIETHQYRFKKQILAFTGGKALTKELDNVAIPHNTNFGGIYNFAPAANYRDLFRNWLAAATDKTLIMCHPGEPDGKLDVIADARLNELNYFLSDDFIKDCKEYSVSL